MRVAAGYFAAVALLACQASGDQGPARVSEHPIHGSDVEGYDHMEYYQYGDDQQQDFLSRDLLKKILNGLGHETTEEGELVRIDLKDFQAYTDWGEHNSLFLRTGLKSNQPMLGDKDLVNTWNGKRPHSKLTMVPHKEDEDEAESTLLVLHMDFFLYADKEDDIAPQVEHSLELFKAEVTLMEEEARKFYEPAEEKGDEL
eukprot:TRINITY_DN54219_c0_g1_i1.p1 TRINITY_DN54219_c0_g1~~TRINITY_DN54219_c0_g1_i1.p1  ORF type:complete len:200 (+),score=97.90 TRINITY_DN54219_c0_g1_i1:200-799(+)